MSLKYIITKYYTAIMIFSNKNKFYKYVVIVKIGVLIMYGIKYFHRKSRII